MPGISGVPFLALMLSANEMAIERLIARPISIYFVPSSGHRIVKLILSFYRADHRRKYLSNEYNHGLPLANCIASPFSPTYYATTLHRDNHALHIGNESAITSNSLVKLSPIISLRWLYREMRSLRQNMETKGNLCRLASWHTTLMRAFRSIEWSVMLAEAGFQNTIRYFV